MNANLVRIPAAVLAQSETAEFNLYMKGVGQEMVKVTSAGEPIDRSLVPVAYFFTERENLSRVLGLALKLAQTAIQEADFDVGFRDHLIEEMAEMLMALRRAKSPDFNPRR